MMKKSKIIIANLCLLLVVGIVFFTYKFNNLRVEERKAQDYMKSKLHLGKKLHEYWILGPSSDELLACKELDKTAPLGFYRCNLDYLNCALSKPIKLNDDSYKGSIESGVVRFSSKKKSHLFKLEYNCHMNYLPQRFYSEGDKRFAQNLWDNFGRHFYIDKFYVTNKEVKEWNNDPKLKSNYQANKTLSLKDKKRFCFSKGKRLLEARFFDAASFLYERDPVQNYFYKYRTHFVKGRSFLSKSKDIEKKNCFNIYIKGCEKFFKFKNYDTIGMSSSGIANVLGGEEEIFINRFDPKRDYKLSSKDLLRNSLYHQLGYRVESKNYKGAFRCMLQL